jgi:acetyl-CoA decarbonylase/synthase complex subunit delta
MEYAYSIMERTRLAALSGDRMLSMPMLALLGNECWKVKEARLPEDEAPMWGPAAERGVLWEATTAACFLHGGAHIFVMWHPRAAQQLRAMVDSLMSEVI